MTTLMRHHEDGKTYWADPRLVEEAERAAEAWIQSGMSDRKLRDAAVHAEQRLRETLEPV